MRIHLATPADVDDLARLKWVDRASGEAASSFDSFVTGFAEWWRAHRSTHSAFIARTDQDEIAGAAWIALLPRVPSPGALNRLSADVQSVFVLPEHRGRGFGSSLVEAAYAHAAEAGAGRITVHSSSRAVPVYRRLGFDSSTRLMQRAVED
ncbi:GNAT family N-acetyltransferase [Microbacterium sp. SD291]|uniref:GNAT family N-acetyltransferase n=1 Tax=Microbacterium sp. SD291 TaxID=2782007 RepID=UPI001A95AE76|nr:GNAT family N-acetyltransferase [Microbacterium sp. SD291]MBO0981480.1 GNAT family N-acetyltransferase [Microbacterium sp. SD291]